MAMAMAMKRKRVSLPPTVSSDAIGVSSTTSTSYIRGSYSENQAFISTAAYLDQPAASYAEQQLSSPNYPNIHESISSTPELVSQVLSNECDTSNHDHYTCNMDLSGFQGMPHLTIAEGLEPLPNQDLDPDRTAPPLLEPQLQPMLMTPVSAPLLSTPGPQPHHSSSSSQPPFLTPQLVKIQSQQQYLW
ncbi:Zonadhesin [Frankliniella fusca]|uniref:Zonadhesin n=1 Tax=Frankliniella fusca TaxID=407009 RepID=A0AAE1HLG1_9NEOP|nr:Zonadhesin [Frankliniella fusca]